MRSTLKCGDKHFKLGTRTFVMGILNVTPDSMSDGGLYLDPSSAVEHAQKLIYDGADIIDIGAESTRPGSQGISQEEELARILPVVKQLTRLGVTNISIDTRRAKVAECCLDEGASWINDVTGLTYDARMREVCRKADAVVLMHARGTPDTMQQGEIVYRDVVRDVHDWLRVCIEESGLPRDKIIVDPGIGFGKRLVHNLELIRHLDAFQDIGAGVLCGLSRKSFIGELTGIKTPADRDMHTLVATAWSISRGVDIVRVHDVATTVQSLELVDALQYS